MARTERFWNQDFQKYMETIASHPNYKGLPIVCKRDGNLSWIASAKSKIGIARKKWAEDRAKSLGFIVQAGVYAQVMLEIHPTKQHVCQICGSCMSIYYHYPNKNFLRSVQKEFGLVFDDCDHISDVWDQILESGITETKLKLFFANKFSIMNVDAKTKGEIIKLCEDACRNGSKNHLGPGAMSNFPDRFDGFHTYNRCCRAEQDKGRSKENLKSYTKDRRAYENWSDGNLHAANMFMGSRFFDGVSADHIGPISLGFVHDPRYLQPMPKGENSTKRDRLTTQDISLICEIENKTDVYPMSWYSTELWEFIKSNYKQYPKIVDTKFRDMLKQNVANFMFVLKEIVDIAGELGEIFLYEEFILSKVGDFEHAYTFEIDGSFSMTPRHRTERSANELERFKRIALTAIDEYAEKTNRHINANLSSVEKEILRSLSDNIIGGTQRNICRDKLNDLMVHIQNRLINEISSLYM